MEQNAGHLTNYRNLRSVVEQTAPADVLPCWHELHYYRADGRLERLGRNHPDLIPGYVIGNTRMLLEFRQALTSQTYDAILTNSWAAMLYAKRISRLPTVIDFDSTPLQIDRMPIYGGPRDPPPIAAIKYRLCRRAYRFAGLLQAWSNWARDSAIHEYGVPAHKVVVNPPGVDLNFFRPAGERRDRKDGRLRVVFVGGDFARKGGNLLLEWFRHQTVGDVELHLATREPVREQPGLFVHDVTPNSPALLQLYQKGDVFVLPSLGECFGIATVEAIAAGLPVVVSDVGGTADIVEHGHNGLIVAAGDVNELSSALAVLLADSALRRDMGVRARQVAEKRFDAKQNALRTLDALRGVATNRDRDEQGSRIKPDEVENPRGSRRSSRHNVCSGAAVAPSGARTL
jgi:glycosyltransferase involved in cell wall biosynthesis